MESISTYLCGGMAGLTDKEMKGWREEAKKLLKTKTFDPTCRDYRGWDTTSIAGEIVADDLSEIDQSKFVLVNATRPSWGTAMEIHYSWETGKKVIAFVGDQDMATISPWLVHHCDEIVFSLEEACSIINDNN